MLFAQYPIQNYYQTTNHLQTLSKIQISMDLQDIL